VDIEQMAAQAELDDADEAIRRARNEELTYEELLDALVGAKVAVPVAGPPGEKWFPATVTTVDKTLLVAAFTQVYLAAAFCAGNREYPRTMLVPLKWVIESTPPTHGILFNMGGENVFEWQAEELNRVRDELISRP
jgi:type III secretion system (T3SS) SseB-like protein